MFGMANYQNIHITMNKFHDEQIILAQIWHKWEECTH